jgi:hypothetical protein
MIRAILILIPILLGAAALDAHSEPPDNRCWVRAEIATPSQIVARAPSDAVLCRRADRYGQRAQAPGYRQLTICRVLPGSHRRCTTRWHLGIHVDQPPPK